MLYVVLSAAFVVVILVALALIGGSSDEKAPDKGPSQERTSPTGTGSRADVEITECSVEEATGWPKAELRVTNHSSKTSDYWIQVEFVDAGDVRIAEGIAVTSNLAPDQVANESASGFRDAKGQITCRITEVTRNAS
ncbi:hypothetical protein ACFWZT_28345 [Streptomyces alboflavus]|uniref:hypothetical protein n=1 Tax=Streptomyces alboflavus TaxID=67267 RepID=UPI003682C8F2